MSIASNCIALGYKDEHGIPSVLYIGNNVDTAKASIQKAGAANKIVFGKVIKDFERHFTYKQRFEAPTLVHK